MTEAEALLVLNAVEGLGAVRIRGLLRHFASGLNVLRASREELAGCGLVAPATARNIFNFSKDKFLQDEYNLMRRSGVVAVTAADDEYPCSLRDFDDAPVVLYIKGDLSTLDKPSVAVVGSRAAGFYGRQAAKGFAWDFAQASLVVVSGLARGIDTAAHQGALEAEGQTLAVVGCGFNFVYPQENRSLLERIAAQGAVVSEFAFRMPPLSHNFPWRNRIISGLSLATVVIEARLKSGALITADYALAQNKDVYVVPSNIDSEVALGSNQLIQEGAKVALKADDVISQILPGKITVKKGERQAVLLTDEQLRVYPHITFQPVHLDELARQSGLSISSLMNVTLSLELKRVIRQLPGQYYVRN